MSDVRLQRYCGADAKRKVDLIADVYDEVYAEPPYNSGPLFQREEFLTRTLAQVQASGFTLITAVTADGSLAGFSFGFSLGNGWWGGDVTPPPDFMENASKFAVIELVVRQSNRGTGLGRTLLSELLSGRQESYAVLTSVREAPAHSIYERWGWRNVGTVQPKAYAPVMDAMALPLSAQSDNEEDRWPMS